ncbi:MAG: ferrous iron transport protein A [Candidatus Aminicenantes bacterium]|nr:ferrous iron transport protein A [Candidatus Aminicenantes bacterium]
MTLTQLGPGERAVVAGLAGGRRLMARMASLGFVPGVEVVMVQNLGRGALIVQVHQARLALGRGEAHRILIVRPHPRVPA